MTLTGIVLFRGESDFHIDVLVRLKDRYSHDIWIHEAQADGGLAQVTSAVADDIVKSLEQAVEEDKTKP